MDIRGDRPDKGDNSGDWYHFFGAMLAWRTTGYVTYAGAVFYLLTGGEEEETDLAGIGTMQLLKDRHANRYLNKNSLGAKPAPNRERACRVEHVLLFNR